MNKEIGVALSGSGFRFPAHIGALQALLDKGHVIKEISGTSGGSIVASLFAVGISPAQMRVFAQSTPFRDFLQFELLEILTKNAMNDGAELLKWLQTYIGKTTTFTDTSIPLTVISTDLNSYSSYIFNKEKTPDFSIALACRYSSCIPLVFEAGQIDGLYLVDGGVSNDLPINYISDSLDKAAIELREPNEPLNGIVHILTLINRVLDTFMLSNSQNQINAAKNCTQVNITTPPNLTLDTSLTAAQIDNLYNLGYKAVMDTIK